MNFLKGPRNFTTEGNSLTKIIKDMRKKNRNKKERKTERKDEHIRVYKLWNAKYITEIMGKIHSVSTSEQHSSSTFATEPIWSFNQLIAEREISRNFAESFEIKTQRLGWKLKRVFVWKSRRNFKRSKCELATISLCESRRVECRPQMKSVQFAKYGRSEIQFCLFHNVISFWNMYRDIESFYISNVLCIKLLVQKCNRKDIDFFCSIELINFILNQIVTLSIESILKNINFFITQVLLKTLYYKFEIQFIDVITASILNFQWLLP